MPAEVDERVEYRIRKYPRIYVVYENTVHDGKVYDDIQIVMRFFGMMIGYVSYAKDIQFEDTCEVIEKILSKIMQM